MSRKSAAAADVLPHIVPIAALPQPPGLGPGEANFWHELVDAYPGRFNAGDVPLVVELCRHRRLAQQVADALAILRSCSLTGTTKKARADRGLFLDLAKLARDESRIIAALSTKLRLVQTSQKLKSAAQAAGERVPAGPRPWEPPN
jgi:hypothetical protein